MLKSSVAITKSRLRQGPILLLRKDYGTRQKKTPKKKVAVILSGSGYLDGTSIHEASAVAVHLNKISAEPVFFAPACPQTEVINHKTQCPVNERRCCFAESARIARGRIFCIQELQSCDMDAVIVPGGFGVAKTLTTFYEDGANCSIDAEVMRVLEEFHDAKKPMGFICIAGILPARLFPCVKVTLGMKGSPQKWPYQYAVDCASNMGAEVEQREVDMYSFDKQHMVFSTPAYMYAGTFADIFDGIGNMIQNLSKYID